MSYVVVECAQRTPEWVEARLGKLTGTGAPKMLAEGKGITRAGLRMALALERLTGRPCDEVPVTRSMQRGTDKESTAVEVYETHTGRAVLPVGFLQHPDLLAGCSLDGYVGEMEGIIEVKCPDSIQHWEYTETGKVPLPYMRQITHNLWISGAAWCDFISFDDRFPAAASLHVIRVPRDNAAIDAYELAARLFLKEVDRQVEDIRALIAGRRTAA